MTSKPRDRRRPLAFEEGDFQWNIQRVPRTLADGCTPHPGRSSAIFVVHGIGQQQWTETAAHLRAGFEDAFEAIADWQEENSRARAAGEAVTLPPPFVYEGYWANYDDVRETFPEDWKHFNDRERAFFENLWRQRVVSSGRTIAWVLGHQIRLLHPRVLKKVGFAAWILYWPLQVVSTAALLVAWLRRPKVLTGFVNDARLYLEPRGVVERAIVHRIDDRVGEAFLRLIGLDRDFRPLPAGRRINAGGERLTFSRVVWVAHSLGTVISYNALSALFHRAAELDASGDSEQKAGVALFRGALRRFVTMGSPLDKVAFLFGPTSLRQWPQVQRGALLPAGEVLPDDERPDTEPGGREWWINFYHVLDPVSGALQNAYICGKQPPANFHIRRGWLPGFAHVGYWRDRTTLRFILGRTYGARFLRDKPYRPLPGWVHGGGAAVAYLVWASALFVGVYVLYRWGPGIVSGAVKAALRGVMG